MDPKATDVKRKRSYDASRRRAEAHRNHARIVESAERLFGRNGYATTTIAAIAAEAELSGVTLAHAADVLWSFSSPELYELLVLRRGWTPKRYGRYIADAMIHALL